MSGNELLKRQFKIVSEEVKKWPAWAHNVQIPHHLHQNQSQESRTPETQQQDQPERPELRKAAEQ